MYPSYGSPPFFKDLQSAPASYPRRIPMAGRSYANPGPGILSAGNMVERESVIIQHPRNTSRDEILEPTMPIPEKKEKDCIIKRLLSTESPVGSLKNQIIIGEKILMAPPPPYLPPPRSAVLLSEEEKQFNTQQILKTLESAVPLKKRKLPFSAELSALPLPLPPQPIDNNVPVLQPEVMRSEANYGNYSGASVVNNNPIPESALARALAAPPLTMLTKNGVTLHAYSEGQEQILLGNGKDLEIVYPKKIETAPVEPQAQCLAKNLNQCGHSVRRLIVVPTLDEDGKWVCAEYIFKQCGWAKKCNTQLHHYKELPMKKEGDNFLGLSAPSGFQRNSPYDEPPRTLGDGEPIPRNLECNHQRVVTGNSLLHQTGFRREVAYVDPVPSNASVRHGIPFMKDESNLKTYICELCLRVEETLWDMTEHRDTDHLGSPVNFLELCSNEKDAMRFRCAAVSQSDTCMEIQIPTLIADSHPPPPIYL